MKTNFVEELKWRGLVQDLIPETETYLLDTPAKGYIGFDPTSDSLHIGSLVQSIILMHFQKAGHCPIVLIGGATGMIGDPSGKSDERNLLDFEILEKNQVRTRVEPTDQGNIFLAILNSWLPMLLIIGIWLFFMRQIQGGGNRAMSFGKIRTQMKDKEQNTVRFNDVQGIDEAKEELTEIV